MEIPGYFLFLIIRKYITCLKLVVCKYNSKFSMLILSLFNFIHEVTTFYICKCREFNYSEKIILVVGCT